MLTLLALILRVVSRLVHLAVYNVYFPRVPPPNWDNKGATNTARIITETRDARGRNNSHPTYFNMGDHIDFSCLPDPKSIERIYFSDVPAVLEIPISITPTTLQAKVQEPDMDDSSMTIVETPSSSDIQFSIYADIFSPDLNKAAFITTPHQSPTFLSAQDCHFSLLKAASERVSEILKENRRRLDAGEDPNINRREARRRRAQELTASRYNGGSLF